MVESIKKLIDGITTFNESSKNFFHVIDRMYYYATNPKALGIVAWGFAVKSSFYICLLICLGGLILHLIGVNKAAKWAKISLFTYLAIQVFNSLM